MKNCFTKVAFAHKKPDNNELNEVNDDDDDTIINEDNWNLLRAEATFNDYVDCNKDVITSAICSVDKLYQNF